MSWDVLDIVPNAFETDSAPSSLPAGTMDTISNVDFYTGTVRALGGFTSRRAMTQAPAALQGFSDASAAYVGILGSLMQVWTPTNALNNIAPTTGLTGAAYWDTTNFGSYMVCTNDTVGQLPHAISVNTAATGGKLAPLAGWPATWECTIISTHRNVLWAGDTIEAGVAYPHRVRWSVSSPTDALPGDWVPAASNDAGQNDIELASSRVVDFCAIGDTMFMGGPGGLWAARWVGGAYVYTFSQINSTQGPRGLRCMASMGDAGVMVTPNDIVVFNESEQFSIATGRILKLVAQFFNVQIMYVPTTRQLIVAYGLQNETGLQHSLIWDRDSNTWGKRDFTNTPFTAIAPLIVPVVTTPTTWATAPYTWDTDIRAWNLPYRQEQIYCGANATGIYTAGNSGYNWFMQRQGMPAPNGDQIRVRSLELNADAAEGTQVRIRIGCSGFAGDPPTWGPIKTYTVGTDKLRHDDAQQGRFFSYQLSGDALIRISGVKLYYSVRSSRP